MIAKEKLHVDVQTGLEPVSRNNQAHLKDKSSAKQSLSVALTASSAQFDRDPRDRNVPEETMTQISSTSTARRIGKSIGRFIAFLYGLAAYLVFFATFLYAIGFVEGLVVPKTIDDGTAVPTAEALIVNLLLMSLFAMQHSVMARRQFKQWWTQYVPKSVERSTYVLFASLALILLVLAVASDADGGVADRRSADRHGDHRPVVRRLADRADQHVPDQSFRAVRIASGRQQSRRPPDAGAAFPHAAVLQVRAAPDLSRLHHRVLGGAHDDGRAFAVRGGDHGVHLRRHLLEERDLIDIFGDEYRRYKDRVSMLVPWRKVGLIGLFIGRNVYAVNLVIGDVALDPLNFRTHALQDAA
jgi:protein-S-isoprenylcysteine O-methyltransferase Ste14